MQNTLISVLICGVNQNYKNQIEKNISLTIGTSYELIYYDNSSKNNSISYVYNVLKNQAQGAFICFIHEDLNFLTQNWGINILDIFNNNSNLGLLGVAGSKFKSKTPSTWSCINKKYLVCNYIQYFKNSNKKSESITQKITNGLEDVVFIDGLFMCVSAELNKKIKFNEEIITNFHGYDFDLCLQTHILKNRICVSDKILIEHFSEGSINDKWYETYKLLCNNWKKNLPLKSLKINFMDTLSLEYSAFYSGLSAIKKVKINKFNEQVVFFLKYFNLNFMWYFFYKKIL